MELLRYAKRGDLYGVKQLIQQGTDVNTVNGGGQSALYLSSENGHYDIAKFLLVNKALVNYRANPLIAAARKGHADCVNLLLKHGAGQRQKAMKVAVQTMNVSVILSLFDHGIRPDIQRDCNCIATKLFSSANAKDATMFCKMLNNGRLSLTSNESVIAAFQFAFKCKSREMASYLLSHHSGTNVEQVYPLAMYYSVRNNWNDILTELLKKATCVRFNMKSSNLLCAACKHSSDKTVQLLLQRGADPNSLCEQPPLMHETAVELLLSYLQKTSYNSTSCHCLLTSEATVKTTPLLVACIRDALAVAKTLLSYGADPNLAVSGNHPLSVASKHGHCDIVKLLLVNGADVHVHDSHEKFPLHYALESVSTDDSAVTVNLLLDYGSDLNVMTTSGETPLYLACSKGLTEVIERMLKCGAKVNISKKSALNAACKNNHMTIVELLLKNGADPNVPEESADQHSFALHIAAADHRNELITLLLNHGANINTADASGNTAVHHACYFRGHIGYKHTFSANAGLSMNTREEVVDTLLCAGAGVNVSNCEGETPLSLAVESGFLDIVDNMISHGGNPNVHTGNQCLLCCACDAQNVKLVEKLLMAGADPNPTAVDTDCEMDTSNELPLCIAAKHSNCELATLLLNYGAEVNMSTLVEGTALHCALRNTDNETVTCMTKLLLDHSADVNQLTPDGYPPLLLLLLDYHSMISHVRSSYRRFQITHVVEDLMHMVIYDGACLDDSSNAVNCYDIAAQFDVKIFETLCSWCSADRMSAELLKSGAGFKLLAFFCGQKFAARVHHKHGKSIRLCQAAVMAGYIPSAEELADLQQSVSGEHILPRHIELLSWLNEDRQQAPSLLRQCRVAIRHQLSVTWCYSTILPAIDQLPLPSELQEYLKFEGSLTEVDLEVEAHTPVMESTTDSEEELSSVDMSDDEESEARCAYFDMLRENMSILRWRYRV